MRMLVDMPTAWRVRPHAHDLVMVKLILWFCIFAHTPKICTAFGPLTQATMTHAERQQWNFIFARRLSLPPSLPPSLDTENAIFHSFIATTHSRLPTICCCCIPIEIFGIFVLVTVQHALEAC